MSDKAIALGSSDEVASLRDELLRVKKQLELTEAQLEKERQEGIPALKQFLAQRFDTVDARLNQIAQVLTSMHADINSIKNSERDDEEKLARICVRLDAWTQAATSQEQTMRGYVRAVQRWLDDWDSLEELTQTFLPSAEHLYDELEKIGASDFSPLIVQYCRSLENEILSKLFISYHEDLLNRITDLEGFVASDLEIRKTERFARSIIRDNRRYSLGDMNWIMQLIKPGGRTLSSSPLLQNFRDFVLRYFDARVAEKDFLDRIKEINDSFRNKAAHPSLMTKEVARKCVERGGVALNEFLNAYRTNVPPLS